MNNALFPERSFLWRKVTERNFIGAVNITNPRGDRYFQIALTKDEAEAMYREGWDVKSPLRSGNGQTIPSSLRVAVLLNKQPPDITLIWSEGERKVKATEMAMLNRNDIYDVDVTVSPVFWKTGNLHGIKAYLTKLVIYMDKRAENGDSENASVQNSASRS